MDSVTIFSTTITVKKQDGTVRGTGTLAVTTTTTTSPPVTTITGTFTPATLAPPAPASTTMNCVGNVVWPTAVGGTANFGFDVSGSANGDFPVGNYRFNGSKNSNGVSGNVVWPGGADPDSGGVEDDTWQASG